MINQHDTLIILTPGFASSEADTNCLPMQQALVRTLQEDFPALNIVVIAFQYPYFKKTYKWYGSTVISFNGKNKGGLLRIMRAKEISAVLNKIHRKNKIIGLLSFWYGECAAVGKNFADKNELKHFCWLLGQDARTGNKHVKQVKAEADELIALSDFLQEEFKRNYGIRPAHVIPPGIDTRRLAMGETKRDVDILGAGSLIPLKRFDLFIELIAEIKKQVPTIRAVLAGNGTAREDLRAMIDRFGLHDNLRLTGELAHPELLKLMQRSKLLLHPSSYEGFSGVCQEAVACGAEVVSFCKPMNQDMEQWHIVTSRNNMLEKIMEILTTTSHTYKQAIPFSMTDVAGRMMKMFRD